MSVATPGELSAQQVIELVATGAYPPEVVKTLARGFLPLPQEELLPVLAYLALSDDAETGSLAQASLGDMPSRIVLDFAMNADAPPEHLTWLLQATRDNLIAEALIRNRAVPDEAIVQLAATTAEAALQEVIVINQSRILRAPEILEALFANPQLAPDARRRALETREEFFEKKARLQQEADEELEEEPLPDDLSLDPIADLLEKAAAEGDKVEPLAVALLESEKKDEKRVSAWAKLQTMTVSERVQAAFKGDRMTRMFLIRDRNRLICSSVMRNPRMTETEIEMISGMRNVDEEVLRQIGMNREWVSKYPIMVSLCRNPKAPVGVVLSLVNRLTLRDLKGLKDDKGVTQTIRDTARRAYIARTKKS
ncbi:MAG: hypothetical protein QOH21_1152 [Acidobacteriota bacterium]|jgi:hypothetical protein|nr:hypothetical protein [Acidobacteriota bacterium]